MLAGHAIKHAVAKANVDPAMVEDVFMGCGMPEGETGMNVGILSQFAVPQDTFAKMLWPVNSAQRHALGWPTGDDIRDNCEPILLLGPAVRGDGGAFHHGG